MRTLTSNTKASAHTTFLPVFFRILILICISEVAVMVLLYALGPGGIWDILLDPVLLAAIASPVIYRSIVKPLSGALEHRKCAEDTARQAQEELLVHQYHEQEIVKAELEKVRDELVRTTRLAAVGQVSAGIAHDLRNSLGSARNAAFYLKRHVPKDEPELTEFLQIIEREIDRAECIIRSLLDLTQSRPVAKRVVDLRQLVEDVFSRITDTDGVHCRVSTDPDPFQIQADLDQVRRVLINLATNAVQAMEGKGELVVEASRSASCDVIIVRDTGPGIPGDMRERAFEPLLTTKAKGTGLGLAICRQIVDRHGGTIEVMENESPGAAFQISLPREGQFVHAE